MIDNLIFLCKEVYQENNIYITIKFIIFIFYLFWLINYLDF
jgi:hypothetical protein